MPRLPTGPTIVLCVTGIVLISLLLAPNRGILWQTIRQWRSRRRLRVETVLAVVEPQSGTTPDEALADELVAHCRDRLASYKCPRRVEFVDVLPRADNGKLYKRRIRDELGVYAGDQAVQWVEEGHLVVTFVPAPHRRSLFGILADKITKHPENEDDWTALLIETRRRGG